MNTDPTKIDIEIDPVRKRMTGISTHGYLRFDVPIMSQIDGNLWQGGCEDGLLLPPFIKHLVSLYPWESYTVEHELSSYLQVVMYDSEDQEFDQMDAIAAWVQRCVDDGPTLVHCQAGLNRSSVVAARVLVLNGRSPSDAIETIRAKRSPVCLCNPSFERWLRATN
jgi:protein-tyrosine phosphatase